MLFNPGIDSWGGNEPEKISKTVKYLDHQDSAWIEKVPSRPDWPATKEEKPCAGLADEIITENIKIDLYGGGIS